MKKIFLSLILFVTLVACSCSRRITPGRYVFVSNQSFFEIDKENNYHFSTSGDVHQIRMFSKGKIKLANSEVKFIPDSSYFFHITIYKYYFDPSLKDNRKIILHFPGDAQANKFQFSFQNGSADTAVDFKTQNYVIYKPAYKSYREGSIVIKAKLRDTAIILPKLLHEFLLSNSVHFFDVNADDSNDSPWNVVEFNLSINQDMFAFTTISPYIYKRKRLIKKEWPIYQLLRK